MTLTDERQDKPCNHFMVWHKQANESFAYYMCSACHWIDTIGTFNTDNPITQLSVARAKAIEECIDGANTCYLLIAEHEAQCFNKGVTAVTRKLRSLLPQKEASVSERLTDEQLDFYKGNVESCVKAGEPLTTTKTMPLYKLILELIQRRASDRKEDNLKPSEVKIWTLESVKELLK